MAAILNIAFAGLVAACLSACAATQTATHETPPWATLSGEAPLVIAHRGASGYLPEHTLEAYALAIDQGADVIEPDLVVTKDGALVARHDRYLSTTTNVAEIPEFADRKRPNPDSNDTARDDWWIEDFTLAELKTLRARQPFEGRSKEFDDQFEIPTFQEVLALAAEKSQQAARPIGVYPETKHPGFFQSISLDFEKPLLAALEDFDAGPVFIQSFEPEILKRLKGKTGAKLVQLVYEETPGAGPNIPLDEVATYADGIGPAKEMLLSERSIAVEEIEFFFVDHAHRLGLFLHPWTFRNDAPNTTYQLYKANFIFPARVDATYFPSTDDPRSELEVYMKLGVDGVFADFPNTAVAVRNNIAGR
jgi:glycerophosphoryl diester phosphodiesterase